MNNWEKEEGRGVGDFFEGRDMRDSLLSPMLRRLQSGEAADALLSGSCSAREEKTKSTIEKRVSALSLDDSFDFHHV